MLRGIRPVAFDFSLSLLLGMDLAKQKAVAMEVGMQNSGLGVAIATANFSPLAAVPSAIFSVWHNISGSILAAIFSWREEKNKHMPGLGEKTRISQ
ncbi:transporter, sodium/bile acid symporter family protein [Geobacillus zalihae]|uniref:Transporter, sodium/bile acid symporter family protein n=1 Tax=Geobacillus zalihae TaxID=213419 RepID=A0A7H1RXJ3_9BACL|nr:transporter, sodium/bile acid symporter family protein [Geobacillus zalihae]